MTVCHKTIKGGTLLVFIVGVGRSGTSLVQSMLNAHPDVTFPPETAFLRRYVAKGVLSRRAVKGDLQSAESILREDEYFKRTGLDAGELVSEALSPRGFSDAAVYLEMLASCASEGKMWVGDKDPRAVEYLPLLKVVFPDVKVLHVFRDPRDVLVSKKKAAWSKSGHVWKHIFASRVQFRIGCKQGPELFGSMYHELCYEDLLSSPEKVLRKLCRDLGLAYDARMLSFWDAARRLVSEKEMSWKKETLGPLMTENKQKWKHDLPTREVRLTELCCRQAMVRGGYKLDDRCAPLGLWDWVWVQIARVVIVLATRPYMLYQDLRVKRACRQYAD
mgnify:CR=1 FL=1